MKVKTSVTLSEELIRRIDRVDTNRSALLEQAAREYLERLEKEARDARDAEILDTDAARLNAEVEDVLEYQELQ